MFNGSCIETLQYLDLSNNNISQISANIYAMTRLITLDLSNNNLHTITEEIDSFGQLTDLDLSDNYLAFLPKEICDLQQLTNLNLSNNALIELPDNIGDFISIQTLNLSNNALQELPLSIINLHNVDINIMGNDEIDLDFRIAAFLYPNHLQLFVLEMDNQNNQNNVYTNTENVHATSIHTSIKNCITTLLLEPNEFSKEELFQSIYGSGVYTDEIMDEINDNINDETILIAVQATYYNIMSRVWSRIIKCVHPGIYARLAEEVRDGMNLCFVGKISRLVNCLSGFYDDIIINISDNESAGSIAQQIIARRRRDFNDEAISWNEETINEIKTTLEERGFSNEVITAWTTDL